MSRPALPTFYPGALSLKLWLVTNFLAAAGWFGWYTWHGESFGWPEQFILPIVITFFSMLTSILALPLAAWLFALIIPLPQTKRLIFTLLTVLFLWLQAVVIITIFIPGTIQDFYRLLPLEGPHLVSAIVAAGFVYRHWLFRAEVLD